MTTPEQAKVNKVEYNRRYRKEHPEAKIRNSIAVRKYYRLHRERILARSKELWNMKTPEEKAKEGQRRYLCRLKHVDSTRRYHNKYCYNLTLEQIKDILISQNNRCAICGTQLSEEGKNRHVDHDHSTDKVRGILCRGCNSGIGFLKENTTILNNAIKYLEKHK
jgi:DNA-directed RNA polymerase subunit RPC12/RpoP